MAPKSCRHASQALRLADFRRALRQHDALACELCAAPAARGNSRSRSGTAASKRSRRSPQSPVEAGGLGDSHGSSRGNSDEALSPAETLNGWAPNLAWEDLYICVTCGYMGCLGRNHFMLHFQMQPKHFIGLHVSSRTFFCCPCKQEVDATKGRVLEMLQECNNSFDEIAGKQQRRVRNKLVTNPTLTPDDDDFANTSRSYVPDSETRKGLDLTELRAMLEADDDMELVANGHVHLQPPLSITVAAREPRPLEYDPAKDCDHALEQSSAPVATELNEAASGKPAPQTAPSVLGFSNLGNTCYFNAATQALLTALHYFPEFTFDEEVIGRFVDSPVAATLMMLNQTVIQKTRSLPPLSPDSASTATATDGWRSRASSVSKNRVPAKPVLTVAPLLKEVRKKFSQFRGNYQQDAHELFTSLLWAIDEEIDPPQLVAPDTSSDDEQKHQPNELVNVFVKTDMGETISLRVSPGASMEQIQTMLAKKLDLDDSELFLQPGGGRQSQRSTMHPRQALATYSKINFVRSLFGGALTTEVRCGACGNCSETVEDAFQLSLPIPANSEGKYITVKDCLQYFTVESHLRVDTETGYECEKCSRPLKHVDDRLPSPMGPPVLRDATMRMRISELPRVLVLHLKRLGRLRKITQHIQFDAMLDMAPHVDDDVLELHESTMYELIAVVVHKGNKRAGHYVSYVSRKNPSSSVKEESAAEDGEDAFAKTTRSTLWTLEDPDHDWFYVSDTLVESVGFDSVLKCEAYMLFYQRVAPATATSPRYTAAAADRATELSELRDTALTYPDRDTSCWL